MQQEAKEKNIRRFTEKRPTPISISSQNLVTTGYLSSSGKLPLVITPNEEGLDLVSWARNNTTFLEDRLLEHGGILFRGFEADSVTTFEQFTSAFSDQLLDYKERSTPRSEVSGRIYTSTEYPANQTIPLHNELSYSRTWPMKIWFFCIQPAETGGETPFADSHHVFQRIPKSIRERFVEKQVMYVRNYTPQIDLPWQEVFQTEDMAEVEHYCRNIDMQFEWISKDHLRTRQVCQVIATHPQTGQTVWFNQAHLFHISNLEPTVRESLLSLYGEQALPRNTYYGDGTPIEAGVLDDIRAIYEEEQVAFPWQKGDIVMLDNMLIAHGRSPFTGARKTVVAMADLFAHQAS